MSRRSSKKSGFPRLARRVLFFGGVFATVAYAGLFLFGLFASDALIFKSPRPPHYDGTLPGLCKIPMIGGGEVAALWEPVDGAKTAILFLHGNSDDLGSLRKRVRSLRELTGCSVLAIDYPGYGLSSGAPSEEGTYRAADAAFGYLVRVRGFAPESVVLRGASLGGGPAVWLASRRHVKGLILDAPFTSTFRTVTRIRLLPFDKFDSLAIVDRVQSPMLVIHGDRDRVVPFREGRELLDAAVNAPVRRFFAVPGAGHEIVIGDDRDPAKREEILRIVEGR